MYLIHAWKESLKLFIPANFKLFSLVYLKTLLSAYRCYFKYGWPFIAAAFVLPVLLFLSILWLSGIPFTLESFQSLTAMDQELLQKVVTSNYLALVM